MIDGFHWACVADTPTGWNIVASRQPMSEPSAGRPLVEGGERAAPELLEHRFSPESYLDLLEHWMELERFEALDAQAAAHLRAAALDRFRRLPAGSFQWRAPLVSVVAERD